ncbi:MAG: ribonuclease P protein component [Alphaproteobacteria bacterium]|nr:ribonuclease P protein component [Alphaproteobacteria bacterium]
MSEKKFTLPSRIRKRKYFLLASNNGRKYVSSGLICQVIENQKDILQVGFTTTKKLGSAVVRNKVRRRMREVVRLFFAPEAPIGYNYVFIGRFNTATRSFEALKKDALYLLRAVQADYEQRLSGKEKSDSLASSTLFEEIGKNGKDSVSTLIGKRIIPAEQNNQSSTLFEGVGKNEKDGSSDLIGKRITPAEQNNQSSTLSEEVGKNGKDRVSTLIGKRITPAEQNNQSSTLSEEVGKNEKDSVSTLIGKRIIPAEQNNQSSTLFEEIGKNGKDSVSTLIGKRIIPAEQNNQSFTLSEESSEKTKINNKFFYVSTTNSEIGE